MNLNLKDKVVIVTGGGRGIGEAIAKTFAEEGAIPVIISLDEKDNLRVVADITKAGGVAYQRPTQLTDPEECKRAVEFAVAKTGKIDGVVNNAGVNDSVNLEHGSYEKFMESMHKNVVHYYMIAHYALPHLKNNKGAIVNIVSKTAETGQGGTSAYAAANGGRNALTREWAVELLKYGIRINGVVVSECWTPMYEWFVAQQPNPKGYLKKVTDRIPLENRMTTPEEIANTVAFLLSSKSSHTTGQLVHVDGGYVHLDRAI
jgi:L-fucose dehydrogenase